MKSSSEQTTVYRRRALCVNRRGWRGCAAQSPWPAVFVALIAFGQVGCATTQVAPSPGRVPFFVAVRYDVEPLIVELGVSGAVSDVNGSLPRPVEAALLRDFEAVRDLGFGTVWVAHFDGAGAKSLLHASTSAGLSLLWPCPDLQHYFRTGVLPAGCTKLPDLSAVVRRCVPVRRPVAELGILDAGGFRRMPRGRQDFVEAVRLLCKPGGVPCVIASARPRAERVGGARRLALIDVGPSAGRGMGQNSLSPREDWLGQYHRALLAGRTDGVLVDRFRRAFGDRPGLVSPQRRMSAESTAALSELLNRVRRWGPLLAGATTESISGEAGRMSGISTVALIAGRRRYLLLVNADVEHYSRRALIIPSVVGGRSVRRAVEVGTDADRPAGRVVDAVNGQMKFRVDLRPGGAVLYELFMGEAGTRQRKVE